MSSFDEGWKMSARKKRAERRREEREVNPARPIQSKISSWAALSCNRVSHISTVFYSLRRELPMRIILICKVEKPYENALCVEFKIKNIPFVQQPRYDVSYKDIKVGEYIPDLIAFNRIIIDTKTIDTITNHERGQMLNYLRITHLRVGLIINFKHPRLQWERIAL